MILYSMQDFTYRRPVKVSQRCEKDTGTLHSPGGKGAEKKCQELIQQLQQMSPPREEEKSRSGAGKGRLQPNAPGGQELEPTAQCGEPDLTLMAKSCHLSNPAYQFDEKWNKHTFSNVTLSRELEMPTFHFMCLLEETSEH